MDNATTEQTDRLTQILAGLTVSDARRATLVRAIEIGADDAAILTLARAKRTSKHPTIILPLGRYEHCARGKGWARRGRGDAAQWGERTSDGYRVGPGRWTVGSSDGFARKDESAWHVEAVQVGAEIWTVAS